MQANPFMPVSYTHLVSSSVSRNTFAVLVGDTPGSKLERAKTLGVRIMTEKEFMDLIEEGSTGYGD